MYVSLQNVSFYTSTINNWQNLLVKDEYKQIILEALNYYVLQKRLILYGFVIMPNHIHLLLHLLEIDQTSFQRNFNKFVSQQIIGSMIANDFEKELLNYKSTQADRIYHIWERRPKWIEVKNNLILNQKLEYIHKNPVSKKWELAENECQYIWSSAKAYETGDISDYPYLTLFSV